MAAISIKDLSVSYNKGKSFVLDKLNLEIKDGEFCVFLGPSGCGKSTAMHCIAGLLHPVGGEIRFGEDVMTSAAGKGKDKTFVPPQERNIAMVFQEYALYPNMTVRENMSFALKTKKAPREEIDKRVSYMARMLSIESLLERRPAELSGGQRQRVALARAISKSPKVFLMDEPLSNLDAKLRVNMRSELIRMHQRLGSTFIYITHDQVEAMTMGDYIAVMKDGVIMQYGTPDEIYTDPQNIFTARFIGEPGMNIAKRPDGMSWGFRSAKVQFQEPSDFHGCVFRGTVLTRERLGDIYHYTISGENGDEYAVRSVAYFDFNEKVSMYIQQEDLYLFDANGDRVRELDLPQPQAGV